MSTIPKRLTVDLYDQMVEYGILPETNRLELIEGRIVEKSPMPPLAAYHAGVCEDVLRKLRLPGWCVRASSPMRIPARDSELEPEVSLVRGEIRDYREQHLGPEDVALVVEVVRWCVDTERELAATYGGGGIPAYWIVNVKDRQLEVYSNPTDGAYLAPRILTDTDTVELVIGGQVAARIAVAELLPQAPGATL